MLLMVMCVCEVMGIEGSEVLMMCVLVNVQYNGLDVKIIFVCCNLFEVMVDDIVVLGKFDCWLIDLLCEGVLVVFKVLVELFQCGGDVVELLLKCIVYVLCNLVMLVCDVGLFVYEVGYRLVGVGVVNMFLYILYVELMVVFECD